MGDSQKLVLGIVAGLMAIIAALYFYMGWPTPTLVSPSPAPSAVVSSTPSPSATPSPAASPSPLLPSPSPSPVVTPTATPSPSVKPSPSASPTQPSPTPSPSVGMLPSVSLFGKINEAVRLEVAPTVNCDPPTIAGLKIEAFEEKAVTTTVPSFQGAAVGAYADALFPVAHLTAGLQYWIAVTPLQSGVFSGVIANQPFKMTGLNATMKAKPGIPIYSQMVTDSIMKAHNIADTGTTLSYRCALYNAYRALMRSSGRIEPIWDFINQYPAVTSTGHVDLNSPFPGSGCEYGVSKLTGNIAPPNLWGPGPGASQALLQAVQADLTSGALPSGSWSYDCDESNCPTTSTLSIAQLRTQYAPALKGMMTGLPSASVTSGGTTYQLSSYFQEFFSVENQAPTGVAGAFGYYVSCMSQGNCSNQTSASVNPATVFPMMVLDAPEVNAVAFPLTVQADGGKAGLYYASTQMLPTAWNAGGQYYSGGNGDGTLLYPGLTGMKGLTTDIPVPSRRLFNIRYGSYLADYVVDGKAAGCTFTNPVSSGQSWSKNLADYEAMRKAIAICAFGYAP